MLFRSYRANRIINWCPFHQTSLSDLELAHIEVDDALTYVRYPFAEGDGQITIATVRPATILADVAVAVHPEDDRYRGLVGRTATLPLVGRALPVIADDYVRTDFGTGALKITPGHDPNDFERRVASRRLAGSGHPKFVGGVSYRLATVRSHVL